MYEIFNGASLANLTRRELLSLLADLQSQFNGAAQDTDRCALRAKIEALKRALEL